MRGPALNMILRFVCDRACGNAVESEGLMAGRTYHVILTRFNVRRGAKADPRVLSMEWLDARMKLFEEITVPSVAAQTQAPDAWLVFFDEDTPQSMKVRFESLSARVPILRAEYCRGLDVKVCVERIRKWAAPDAERLVTTRLDNDDALNPRFIERVHEVLDTDAREFINPTHGLIFAAGSLYRKRDYSSPFISLSEPMEGCRTVLVDEHQRLSRHGRIRQFDLKDAWIQVVHGGNLANQVRGLRVSPVHVELGILPPGLRGSVEHLSFAELALDNSFGAVRRYTASLRRRVKRMWFDHKVPRAPARK